MISDEIRKILLDHCREFGSQSGWAKAHSVSPAYVSDVLSCRRDPGPKLLRALNLRVAVTASGDAIHADPDHQYAAYSSWQNMLQRCQNPKNPRYMDYGGRGITVCERWQDFRNFLADMGDRPAGFTLERKDNSGNYEPGNCIWLIAYMQAKNRRRAKSGTSVAGWKK